VLRELATAKLPESAAAILQLVPESALGGAPFSGDECPRTEAAFSPPEHVSTSGAAAITDTALIDKDSPIFKMLMAVSDSVNLPAGCSTAGAFSFLGTVEGGDVSAGESS
jgi:hypothetical protein